VLDILYSFLPWMPSFQDDPEHQVYLEAVSRAAAQAGTFSPYRSLVLIDEPHRTRSIESTIRDILAPIADDLVEVDEDIMASVPRDRLNIMTIHQAKGLEYPLVIVDVASDFKTNHPHAALSEVSGFSFVGHGDGGRSGGLHPDRRSAHGADGYPSAASRT